jgi:ribonuclease P protein component
MLPREQRLRDPKMYQQVFKRGTWARGRAFSIVYLPVPQPGKIGFVITKKVSKSSVDRNSSKRRIRAVLRSLLAQEKFASLPKRYSMVVVIHSLVDDIDHTGLLAQAEHVLAKIPATA